MPAAKSTRAGFGPSRRAAGQVQGRGVRRLGTQHPKSADFQGHSGGHARPGQRRAGRGQGDQRRGRVGQTVRGVGCRSLRRVLRDSLVAGRRHVTRRVPETGKRTE